MKRKILKRGLIFTLLLALIFSSTIFAFADSTDTWTKKAPMLLTQAGFEAQVLDGKIYAIGGETETSKLLGDVEVYDPKTDTWSKKAPMPNPRMNFCTAVVNGKIYAIGGGNGSKDPIPVEEYDPSTDKWTTKASMPDIRMFFCTEVVDGIIYVIGGMKTGAPIVSYPSVEAYDPSTDKWTPKARMQTPRFSFKTEVLDGKIYAMGGNTDRGVLQNTVEVYNPSANTWMQIGIFAC